MNFTEIAQQIIQDSIRSAVYIDDRIKPPYEEFVGAADVSELDLYRTFKNKNCSLDIFRFSPSTMDEWDTNRPFLLEGRDLLILDWQLEVDNKEGKYTLDILKEAVSTDSLHFCCIHTAEDSKEFDNILYSIITYFLGNENKLNLIRQEIIAKFDDIITGSGLGEAERTLLYDELKRILRTFIFSDKEGQVRYLETVKDFFYSENLGDLILDKDSNYFVLLSLALEYKNEDESINFVLGNLNIHTDIQISHSQKNTFYVNNTIIKIINKDEVKADNLYNTFRDSLINEHNIFLTLMGLEMRNMFRKGSAFIGKELNGINENVFFYHENALEKDKELFYEYLRDIWKEQAASFLLQEEPKLWSSIAEYKKGKTHLVKQKLEDYVRNNPIDLVKLNLIYNQIQVKRKQNDILRFGDVFKYKLGEDEYEYMICITPHCDCANASKINNNFFFVKGKKCDMKHAVSETETKYISFLKINSSEDLICIDWKGEAESCKPFTMYIPIPQMADYKISPTYYLDKKLELNYLGTIKENYVQRIANNAFGYAMRVGITAVQLIKPKKETKEPTAESDPTIPKVITEDGNKIIIEKKN